VYSIIRDTTFTPPIEIRRLAQITNFKLFVTTTFDTLIEQALNEERFGSGRGTLTIGYAPNNIRDIDAGQQKLASPVVYHLLGVVSPKPSYVISDEDLLEFICTLQSSDRRPSHLFDELQNSHLLFLGCSNFSDWLSRFFLRTTKRRRLSDSRDELEIVADDCMRADPGLVGFLATYSTRTKVFTGDHSAFIEELWTRWSARSPTNLAAAPTGGMPDGAIFISYAREDFDVACNLWASMEAAGISAWFDREQLMAGADFETKIRDNIQVRAFPATPVKKRGPAAGRLLPPGMELCARPGQEHRPQRAFHHPGRRRRHRPEGSEVRSTTISAAASRAIKGRRGHEGLRHDARRTGPAPVTRKGEAAPAIDADRPWPGLVAFTEPFREFF
jgi:hypothetical protein